MKVIGLTGSIGMGKSTAAAAFRRLRIPVFDADATVHRLQARGGPAIQAIAAAFPGTVTNATLDRAKLRHLMLQDPQKRAHLEAIIHPLVRAEQRRFLARHARAALVVLDIPLLLETGYRPDVVLVVSAPRAIQLARIRARHKMPDDEIHKMIALQMPDKEKRKRADIVINTGLSRYHAQRAIRHFTKKVRLGEMCHPPQTPRHY